jgi:hypothetical protein
LIAGLLKKLVNNGKNQIPTTCLNSAQARDYRKGVAQGSRFGGQRVEPVPVAH